MTPDFDRLSRNLGYEFRDKNLLYLAMTHRSANRLKNYERLEFLGDSIVNFLIADALFERFTQANEGQLSRLRAELVKGQTLAELAREFALGDYLRLGPGELKSGGFGRDSILADAMESVIGAIYLDSGMDVCRERVAHWFANRLQKTQIDAQKDAKTRLQEMLQSFKYALPVYVVCSAEGEPHNQVFSVQCTVPEIEFVAHGVGSSRRKAEQEAALSYLRWIEERGLKNISNE